MLHSVSRSAITDIVTQEIEGTVALMKTDRRLGLIFGHGMVCKTRDESGAVQPYYDLHGDHAPEEEMVKAAMKFAATSRPGKAQHAGDQIGTILFMFPMTEDIAKGLDYPPLAKYGLLIAFKPSDPKIMDDVDAGLYKGFSFGGSAIRQAVSS